MGSIIKSIGHGLLAAGILLIVIYVFGAYLIHGATNHAAPDALESPEISATRLATRSPSAPISRQVSPWYFSGGTYWARMLPDDEAQADSRRAMSTWPTARSG